MGSPSSIVMGGFGNGTFAGSPSLIVTFGYGIGSGVTTITDIGLEWTLPINIMHHKLIENRPPPYALPNNRMEYILPRK